MARPKTLGADDPREGAATRAKVVVGVAKDRASAPDWAQVAGLALHILASKEGAVHRPVLAPQAMARVEFET